MSGGVTKEMMDGLPVFAKSIISEQDKEIASLKEKIKNLEQENSHLRKVNGIKLKKTTIKQSLVYANEALEKEREKVKELETVIGAWHNIFGTTQLSHAKDRLDVSEEKVKRQEAQISSLRTGLEKIERLSINFMNETGGIVREPLNRIQELAEQALSLLRRRV